MACYLSIEPLDLDHLHTLLKKNNFHNYLKCYCDNLLIGRLNTLITFFWLKIATVFHIYVTQIY